MLGKLVLAHYSGINSELCAGTVQRLQLLNCKDLESLFRLVVQAAILVVEIIQWREVVKAELIDFRSRVFINFEERGSFFSVAGEEESELVVNTAIDLTVGGKAEAGVTCRIHGVHAVIVAVDGTTNISSSCS